jgi:hypothetical protein
MTAHPELRESGAAWCHAPSFTPRTGIEGRRDKDRWSSGGACKLERNVRVEGVRQHRTRAVRKPGLFVGKRNKSERERESSGDLGREQ